MPEAPARATSRTSRQGLRTPDWTLDPSGWEGHSGNPYGHSVLPLTKEATRGLLLGPSLQLARRAIEHKNADAHAAKLIVAKQRNGPPRTVRLTFFSEHTRFENYAEDKASFGAELEEL